MGVADLLSPQRIELNLSLRDKQAVLERLVELEGRGDAIMDLEAFRRDMMAREAQGGTAVEAGIAVPHAKSSAVRYPSLAVVTLQEGIDCGALDGVPSDVFFMIAVPADAELHMAVLARLTTLLMEPTFLEQLRQAVTPEEFLHLVDEFEQRLPQLNSKWQVAPTAKVLAVTACPTGIAHTYMAADALERAGQRLGVSVKVETQGAGGTKNKLTQQEIRQCTAVIIAAGREVDMSRFQGIKVLRVSVNEGIYRAEELIQRAAAGDVPVYGGTDLPREVERIERIGVRSYRQLMNGVSHMLPFVIGGGILVALAFLLDDMSLGYAHFGSNTPVSAWLRAIGQTALGFMLPILAGFTSVAIADRPGMMVGFVGGALASSGATLAAPAGSGVSAGFLGAIIAGFAGGYLMVGLKKLLDRLPGTMEGIKSILLYPVAGLLMVGLFMCLINPFVGALNNALFGTLQTLGPQSRVVLGAVLAGMMAIDMGGPFNKAAYLFGTSTLAALATGKESDVMAAVMIGGMVPPLVIALATTFCKSCFTPEECKSGGVNYILGLCFVTEGAVPYAASDPLRVLPACILGSAVAGGLSMLLGCAVPAPHGGIFLCPVMINPGGYLAALAAGSLVGMLMLAVLKKNRTILRER